MLRRTMPAPADNNPPADRYVPMSTCTITRIENGVVKTTTATRWARAKTHSKRSRETQTEKTEPE